MSRRRKRLLIGAAVAAAGLVAVVLGVRVWLHGAIERGVTTLLGRNLTIAGTFDLSLGSPVTLVAEDVRLANAPWGSQPYMARIGRVKASIDFSSLWSPPLRLRDVEVEGVRILLETNEKGVWNWAPEKQAAAPAPPVKQPVPARPPAARPPAKAAAEPKAGPPFVFDRAALHDLELVWRSGRNAPARTLVVGRFETRTDRATDMITLDASGRLDDEPWKLAGRAGTFAAMLGGREVEHDVAGALGSTRFSSRGRVRKLTSLADPIVEVAIEGTEIRQTLGKLGLQSSLTGAFHLRGRLSPAGRSVGFDVDAGLGSVTAAVRGTLASLLRPGAVAADVEASGPDASLVGTWTRVSGLPARPFTLEGRARLGGRSLSLDDVHVRAGGTSIVVRGAIGLTRGAVGTDLYVDGGGSDLAELRALTRVMLPSGAFTVRGKFLRRADALAIEDVEVGVNGSVVRGGGTIGEPPRLANLDLTVDASGRDLSTFSGLARVTLPRAPFSLRGRVGRQGRAFVLDGIEARVADDFVTADASLTPAPRLAGSEIRASISGPDFRAAAARAGLHFKSSSKPYEISGRMRVVSGGFDLTEGEARAGGISASVEGQVGSRLMGGGTTLECSLTGPALSELSDWGVGGTLPAAPFTASAQLHLAPERVELRGAKASLGDADVRADGAIGLAGKLRGTDLSFEVRSPDTSVASILTGVTLPAGLLDARGRFVRAESTFRFDDITASIGEIRAKLSGTLGQAPDFAMTSLVARASGPDLSLALGPPTGGLPLPAEAFDLSTALEGGGEHFASKGFQAHLGSSDLEGGFVVSRAERTVVDADLRSNRLDILEWLGGSSGSAAKPVTRRSTTAPGAEASNGDAGTTSLAANGSAAGASSVTRGAEAPKQPQDAARPAPPQPEARRERQRFFSDRPIPIATLRAVDASLTIPVGELILSGYRMRDVTITGTLFDGVVRFDRLEAVGPDGGKLTASLVLEPFDDGYRLRSEGALAGARLSMPDSGIAPEKAPIIDVEFEVTGEGRSPHAIASSSDGRMLLTLGPGQLPNNLGDFISSGVGRALLEALNPFRKSSPYTACECGVMAATLAGGKAEVEPIVARSDKLTIVGNGSIDFHTEDIGLEWTLKPREGVGISAGSIANPYVGLGGTLSEPSLELKTAHAFASAGAAIATAGGTIILKGLFDRVTAEQQVCLEAIERARKEAEAPKGR